MFSLWALTGKFCFWRFVSNKLPDQPAPVLGGLWAIKVQTSLRLYSEVCEQQRCRLACAFTLSDQHLCYLLIGKHNTFVSTLKCYKWNFTFLASLCGWAGQFGWLRQVLLYMTRRVIEAFYRVCTLEGIPPYNWRQGWSLVTKNGLRAFHRAKMSSHDTQLKSISCIFHPKFTSNKKQQLYLQLQVVRTCIFMYTSRRPLMTMCMNCGFKLYFAIMLSGNMPFKCILKSGL